MTTDGTDNYNLVQGWLLSSDGFLQYLIFTWWLRSLTFFYITNIIHKTISESRKLNIMHKAQDYYSTVYCA